MISRLVGDRRRHWSRYKDEREKTLAQKTQDLEKIQKNATVDPNRPTVPMAGPARKAHKAYVDEEKKAAAQATIKQAQDALLTQNKPHMNIVVVGARGAGKSTLIGHMMYKTGAIQKSRIAKLEAAAAAQGKGMDRFAWLCNRHANEREWDTTVSARAHYFESERYRWTAIDAPGCTDFLKNKLRAMSLASIATLVVPIDEYTHVLSDAGVHEEMVRQQPLSPASSKLVMSPRSVFSRHSSAKPAPLLPDLTSPRSVTSGRSSRRLSSSLPGAPENTHATSPHLSQYSPRQSEASPRLSVASPRSFIPEIAGSQVSSHTGDAYAASEIPPSRYRFDAKKYSDDGRVRRELNLAFCLGIRQILVVIAKMDEIEWNQQVYEDLRDNICSQARRAGFCDAGFTIVPAVLTEGDNLTEPGRNMQWYKGPTVLSALDAMVLPPAYVQEAMLAKPPRLTVFESHQRGRDFIVTGLLTGGTLSVGSLLCSTAGGRPFGHEVRSARVKSIRIGGKSGTEDAKAGMFVGLRLHRIKYAESRGMSSFQRRRGRCIGVGRVLSTQQGALVRPKQLEATLVLRSTPGNDMRPGYGPMLHCHCGRVPCSIEKFVFRNRRVAADPQVHDPRQAKAGDSIDMIIRPLRPINMTTFNDCPELGRIVLTDSRIVVAIGVVRTILVDEADVSSANGGPEVTANASEDLSDGEESDGSTPEDADQDTQDSRASL